MSKLCICLPPFSPDYSGVASALFELGGMIVIHDASGCTGNYIGFDEPRWYGSKSIVYCSGLRHMDAVLGSDDKLIDRIVKAAKSTNPKFIAILGSPVPMVVGTDFEGIAYEIEKTTGIVSFGFATKGLAYYGRGISDAMIAVIKRFAKNDTAAAPDSINLLGITPLDFSANSNSGDFKRLFTDNGIAVIASFSMGLTFEQIEKSPSAGLNVAVSQSGIEIAEYMKKTYGTPYIIGTPIGDGEDILSSVKNALNGEFSEEQSSNPNADILIAGEQVISNSIREYLQKRCGYGGIHVASLFDTDTSQQADGDITVKNELQLRKLLNSRKYGKVIADPMIRPLIAAADTSFYDFPHVAVSSKLYWDEYRQFLGKDTKAWLQAIADEK